MYLTVYEAINILRPEPPNLDGLKKAYRAKAIKYHPDRNPNGLEMMKLVNNANEVLLKNPHAWISEKSRDYSKIKETPLDEAMQNIINKIKRWPDLEIEIIGSWLWIRAKDILQYAVKFAFMDVRYSKKRGAYYWHPPDFEFSGEGAEMTMEEMRRSFGSKKVESDPWKQI